MNQALFERIEDFLMGSLSVVENEKFESEMSQDANLRKEVELQREHMLAIELGALTGSLKEISIQYDNEHPHITKVVSKRSFNVRTWSLGIAAGLVLTIGLFFLLKEPNNPKTELLIALNTPDAGLPVPMSATDKYAFHDAMVDYKVGDYQKALDKWLLLYEASSGNDTLEFYIAAAFQGLGEYDLSLPYLEKIKGAKTSVWKGKAAWRSALAYYSKEDLASLESVSKEIPELYQKNYQLMVASLLQE